MTGDRIEPKQMIAHYELEAEIGAGGMGVVWRARDTRLGREVAIKLLPSLEREDPTSRARLLQEARLASALNHPHICTIYEVGEFEGQCYIAMELVEGRTLDKLLAENPPPLETLLRYARQIADALSHAHQHGVIHRDLKSSNVAVTPEGRTKVLDFGLAKRLTTQIADTMEASLLPTATGIVVGTPYAIPPEVLHGERADARGDVWAFGVLLYEMVARRRPFSGRTAFELTAQILNQPAPSLPHDLPAPLAALIARCLEKDPARRYAHAGELKTALDALREDARGAGDRQRRAIGARAWVGIAAVVLAGVAAAWFFAWRGGGETPRIRSIAVLPLANYSRDPDQDYFADGTTEALIAQLAQVGTLKVISRTSVMRYKNTRLSLRDVARELGVDAVIEGSVERSGNRVRITAQLIEAATDQHLWARSYLRDLEDVLTLQDEVAVDIAQQIRAQVTPEEHRRMSRHQSMNPQVYDLYLRGHYLLNRGDEESIKTSVEMFRKAIELDPKDAQSYTGLADAYTIMTEILHVIPMNEGWPLVRENARKALELDDELAEAHASMGIALWFVDFDWGGAERELRRAIELNPNYATAHDVLGLLLICTDRVEEGLAEARRAAALDPLSIFVGSNVQFSFYLARRYDEARAQGDRVLALDPGSPRVHYVLRRLCELSGDFPKAIEHSAFVDSPDTLGRKAAPLALAAFRARGVRGYWDFWVGFERARHEDQYAPAWFAITLVCAGDHDAAFQALDRAVATHQADLVFLRADPLYDPIRHDPRFDALLTRLNAPR